MSRMIDRRRGGLYTERIANPTEYTAVRWGCRAPACNNPATRSDRLTGAPLCLPCRRRRGPIPIPRDWPRAVIDACNVLGMHPDDATTRAVLERCAFLSTMHAHAGDGGSGGRRLKEISDARALLLTVLTETLVNGGQ